MHALGLVGQVEGHLAGAQHVGIHRHAADKIESIVQLDDITHLGARTQGHFQHNAGQVGDVVGVGSTGVGGGGQVHASRYGQRGEVPVGCLAQAGIGVAGAVGQRGVIHQHIVTGAIVQCGTGVQGHLVARYHHAGTGGHVEGFHGAVIRGLLDHNRAGRALGHILVEGHHQRGRRNNVGCIIRGA